LLACVNRYFGAIQGLLGADVVCGLKIAVVADRFQSGAAELRCDVLGRNVESARRGIPPLEQVGREKPDVALQGLRGNPIQRAFPMGSKRGRVGEQGRRERQGAPARSTTNKGTHLLSV